MKLFYWKGPVGNFGDDLNLWLWDFLLPEWRDWDSERYLVGVGTILGGLKDLNEHDPLLIVGSGVGYGEVPLLESFDQCDVRCVRGAETAQYLGLSKDQGIIDPAVMVCKMPEFQALEPTGKRIFVPHWQSVTHSMVDWVKICKQADLSFVSPSLPSKEVIRAIARSSLVVAESMHAAIIADAFRVPWIAVHAHPSFNQFKWKDWAETVGVEVLIHDLYASGENSFCTRGESQMLGLKADHESVATASTIIEMLKKSRVVVRMVRYCRTVIQSKRAVKNLKRIAVIEPNLSDNLILNERIARFETILSEIRADYA